MQTMTDKIVFFHPPRVAEEIGGNAADAMAVMKASNQAAVNQALTWFHQGKTADPWPLASASARGALLVDLRTEQLCDCILDAISQVVAGTSAETADLNHWHQQLMEHWAGSKDFERRQFHRDEIARWLRAMDLHSNYQFGSNTTLPPDAGSESLEAGRRRYELCLARGLKMPVSSYAKLPEGIGALAREDGVSTQAFSSSLKRYIDTLQRQP